MSKKSNVGVLFPDDDELNIYREFLTEATDRLGRKGLFYPVTKLEIVNTDTYYEWGSPTEISYILVNNPRISLLEKFGWNYEDKTIRPMVCYMSFLDSNYKGIDPTEGCLLEISSRTKPDSTNVETKKFQVVDAATDPEMNMFICNIAPYREKIKPNKPIPSQTDPSQEELYFRRKTIYSKPGNTYEGNEN